MKYAHLLCLLLFASCMHAQNRYDVVIDEIMADPTPQIGLPNNEWIELNNVSASSINLQNWRIADANGQSGLFPYFVLQPDSVVIICSSSAAANLSLFGNVITVTSFPSLDNDRDLLYIKSST